MNVNSKANLTITINADVEFQINKESGAVEILDVQADADQKGEVQLGMPMLMSAAAEMKLRRVLTDAVFRHVSHHSSLALQTIDKTEVIDHHIIKAPKGQVH